MIELRNLLNTSHLSETLWAFQEKCMARIVDKLHEASLHYMELGRKHRVHIYARDAFILLCSRWIEWNEMQMKSIRGKLARRMIEAFRYEGNRWGPARDISRRYSFYEAKDSNFNKDLWALLGASKFKCVTLRDHWNRRRPRRNKDSEPEVLREYEFAAGKYSKDVALRNIMLRLQTHISPDEFSLICNSILGDSSFISQIIDDAWERGAFSDTDLRSFLHSFRHLSRQNVSMILEHFSSRIEDRDGVISLITLTWRF
jgi:hypothetical protein